MKKPVRIMLDSIPEDKREEVLATALEVDEFRGWAIVERDVMRGIELNTKAKKARKANKRAMVETKKLHRYWCANRGGQIGTTKCASCASSMRPLYNCTVHGSCVVGSEPVDRSIKQCEFCFDRRGGYKDIDFSTLMDRHAGSTFWIMGSGPTSFDYNRMKDVTDPVLFINLTAQLEPLVPKETPTYFVGIDAVQRYWLDKFRGTFVLAEGDSDWLKHFKIKYAAPLQKAQSITWWRNGPKRQDHLLQINRKDVSVEKRLYTAVGSICPALHFAWYTGAKKVMLVGCDGKRTGYDERLKNLTGQRPGMLYPKIRDLQENVMDCLRLEREYV